MTNTHFFDTEIGIAPGVEVLLEYSVTLNYSWRVRSSLLREQVEFGDGQHSRISPLPTSTLPPYRHLLWASGAGRHSRAGQAPLLGADPHQNFRKESKWSSCSSHLTEVVFIYISSTLYLEIPDYYFLHTIPTYVLPHQVLKYRLYIQYWTSRKSFLKYQLYFCHKRSRELLTFSAF